MDIYRKVVGQAMKRTGVTLIELLVVVAIVAILAAILWPVLFGGNNGEQPTWNKRNVIVMPDYHHDR